MDILFDLFIALALLFMWFGIKRADEVISRLSTLKDQSNQELTAQFEEIAAQLMQVKNRADELNVRFESLENRFYLLEDDEDTPSWKEAV